MFIAWQEEFEAHGCPPLTIDEWAAEIGTTGGLDLVELIRHARDGHRSTRTRCTRGAGSGATSCSSARSTRPGVRRVARRRRRARARARDRFELAGRVGRAAPRTARPRAPVRVRRRVSATGSRESPRPTPTSPRAPRSVSRPAPRSRSRIRRTASRRRRRRACAASPCRTRSPQRLDLSGSRPSLALARRCDVARGARRFRMDAVRLDRPSASPSEQSVSSDRPTGRCPATRTATTPVSSWSNCDAREGSTPTRSSRPSCTAVESQVDGRNWYAP